MMTTMKRISLFLSLFVAGMLLVGADGCSSDPNVEGAKLDLRNKDYDRAIENLDKALEKNPENVDAMIMKGDALLEKAFASEDTQQHTSLFNEAVEFYGNAGQLQGDVDRKLDIAYAREFERAVQYFNRGAKDDSQYAVAAQYFENTSMVRPDSTGPMTYRGYALLNSGDESGAIESLAKSVEKGEDDAQVYIYLADLYVRADRPADAVELLEKGESMFPGDADMQAQLLSAYQAAGMLDRAMGKYKSAIETDPDNKTYLYNYGSLLLQSGEYEEAITHLQRATQLDPEYSSAWYNLGAAHQNKAVGFNEEVTKLDDNLRENRADMSSEQVREIEGQIDALVEKRRDSFSNAIGPLETAKTLTDAEGGSAEGICVALYTAYVQTDQLDKAQTVAECAGFDE